jgi:meso-butanediol dehydrogenase / (S,S)-butanediol dehydrogenase / diacetyl reductase
MQGLEGKNALVTGGGTGIGAAITRRLQREGVRVTPMGRREAPLKEVSEHYVVGDVTSVADCRRAIDAAGPVDILVHNAGAWRTGWDEVVAVNLTAAHHLVELAQGDLVERRGSIITIGSTAAFVSGAIDADYNAAKAGLVMLTRSVAVRLGPHGVRANAVCPGWVRTPGGDDDMRLLNEDIEEAYRRASRYAPLRRPAMPEEIASVVCFLASEDASYMTGAVLMVDGGSTAVDVLLVDY